jgi:molybdenum cofactor cytidylyltransferase
MIAAVVIASGFSRRMGRPKLSLEIGGRTLLHRAIDACVHARGIGRCLVVVRPEDESHVRSDAELAVEPLINQVAAEGQSASIRLAADRLAQDEDCEAAVYVVVDQPFLTPEVVGRLTAAWRAGEGEIVVSTYDGQRGNPVLFARRFFRELSDLTGDVGGREVIRRHADVVRDVEMPDPAAGQDVDTWEEFLSAQRRAGD